ncbi:MAG: hypothetical protein E7036_02580 [Opitutales bacterium]|nr:hypothetical protein [Opitutales bacterium]
MNRKSFFKHLSFLTASAGIFARAAEAAKAKVGIAPKKKFTYDKKIFKLGKYTIRVKIPEYFKPKMKDLSFVFRRDNMQFEDPTNLQPKIDGDFFVFDVEFTAEDKYYINVHDKSKKKRAYLPIESISMYALAEDLYETRVMKGDSHIHTTNSDGKFSPDEVALRCYEVGLDYQAISDHRRWDTSDIIMKKFGKYNTSMTFYHAEECHFAKDDIQNFGGSQGLTKYVNANKAEFEKLVAEKMASLPKDMEKPVKLEVATVEAEAHLIRQFGGIPVFNHPYWITSRGFYNKSVDAIWERKSVDAIETVTFGRRHGNRPYSTSLLIEKNAEMRERGIKIPLIGTTDAHHISNQGNAYTIVFTKSNKWEDTKQAVLARRMVAVCDSTYNELELEKRETMMYGERRFIKYANFLIKEYFPAHDKLIAEEGKVLAEIIQKGETEERLAKLKVLSEKAKAYWDSVKA